MFCIQSDFGMGWQRRTLLELNVCVFAVSVDDVIRRTVVRDSVDRLFAHIPSTSDFITGMNTTLETQFARLLQRFSALYRPSSGG